MCDFHSIAIRYDGAIAHVKENSHSAAVLAAGWQENTPERQIFWEAEWHGQGDFPSTLVQARVGAEPPAKVLRVAEAHYRDLAETLRTGVIHKRFESMAYADVRLNVASNPATQPETLAQLATDVNPNVRCNVARNPATPPAILAQLATDVNPNVRLAAPEPAST